MYQYCCVILACNTIAVAMVLVDSCTDTTKDGALCQLQCESIEAMNKVRLLLIPEPTVLKYVEFICRDGTFI